MSTIDAGFLRTVVLVTGFRGEAADAATAAMLLVGLRGQDWSAADMPAEVWKGDTHLAGIVTARLISMKVVEVVGRVKSPNANANGRKVSVLRIPANKVSTARSWLAKRGYVDAEQQGTLALAM